MNLYTTYPHDGPRVAAAFQLWVQKCLIADGSVFSEARLSTASNFEALDRYFVKQPDAGDGGFYEKLKTQLASAEPDARKLMAEVLWALFLFPSNISEEVKRRGILDTWSWSGDELDPAHPLLADANLEGIGSAGMGVNSNRWREINYIVGLGRTVKAMKPDSRAEVFSDYNRFMAWIETVPKEGNRQFRHMMRFFLFPERVERMSSNGDRVKALAAFGVAKAKELRKWDDKKLDTALLKLREEMEVKYDTKELDFYRPPLRGIWKAENEPDDAPLVDPDPAADVSEPASDYVVAPSRPRNLILYGPPGTGKTYRLQQMFSAYTDQPADVDRNTWEIGLVARFGWRAAIAAALAQIGHPAKVAELSEHPLVKAKTLERERKKGIQGTLWGYLQEHTPLDVGTVNTGIRRAPFVFTKNDSSQWSLMDDWRDIDAQAAELFLEWNGGPGSDQKPVQRYRVVTFHPSYAYEDFVIGLRPVVAAQGAGASPTEFRMVDGVFKQICAQAKANPSKRYALFIDEINRANIAKVFGELITLVEDDKRALYDATGNLIGGLEVQLPGTSAEDVEVYRFGVPSNLDIYGTMNTADRSIALLDIALRRRFEFEQLAPAYEVIDRRVENVDLSRLLRQINDRLEYLADRDRQIGHAYFMKIKSLDELRACFKLQIIPLLQEYFFDDWSRVQLVLSRKDGGSPFISRQKLDGAALFGGADEGLRAERDRFSFTDTAGWDAAAFQSLYDGQPLGNAVQAK